ncbi:MAG TPA: sigma-70 family RNA polymerase sigma factor [Lysobacter sp.]|nr:sigma-70 family RNA polymerase sigma factor [Lysobacter sp.]
MIRRTGQCGGCSSIEPTPACPVLTGTRIERMAQRPRLGNDAAETRGVAPVDEVALMGRIAAEETEAFETLYRLYHPRLIRFLQGMTRRPALVEEVLDDTMLVVWRKAHTYRADAKVSTWIFAIAYRQALKALRQVDDAVEWDANAAAESQSSPDGELQQHELRARLEQALQLLSAEQRAAIELTYYLGYACREIAQIMDCPVDTVKTRMFYARKRLRTLLGASAEEAI